MKTKQSILERYEKHGNTYLIQVSTNNFKSLFNEFDRTASFIKRDLNYDFAEYLFESAEDLVCHNFKICLNLHSENKSMELEDKVNKGIDNYFEYEINLITKEKIKVKKRIFIHILIATICFFISFTLNKIINSESFFHMLFVESTLIAAWVLMWPVFSEFIYNLNGIKKKIDVYNKIISAKIEFRYMD